MDRKELTQNYWQYYLLLERRFLETIDFVELHINNYNTFSNTYALLLQSIGAELDTVFKTICGFNTCERKTISDYSHCLLYKMPKIIEQKIYIPKYDIEIQPFMNWDAEHPAESLVWWTAFNDVKHNRYSMMKQASLRNVLDILGALFLVEMLILKEITDGTNEMDVFDESSNLFTLKNWSTKAVPLDQIINYFSRIVDGDASELDLRFDA